MSTAHKDNQFANYNDDGDEEVAIGLNIGNVQDAMYDTPQDKRIKQLEAERENAIALVGENKFMFRDYTFSTIGFQVPDNMQDTEAVEIIKGLKDVDEAVAWTVGDLVNFLELKWGAKYEVLEEQTGYTYQTLADYAYLARRIDFSLRNENLRAGHHRVVAPIKNKREQKKWLDRCAKEGWSIVEFRRQIAMSKRSTKQVDDILHRDKKPKFTGVEKVVQRALVSRNDDDVIAARERLSKLREQMNTYITALEDELLDNS